MLDDPAGQDFAKQARETGADILAKLDQLTAGSQPIESVPQPTKPSMNEQLDALELLLEAAVNSGNETEVRRLGQEGKDAIRAERAAQERLLEVAQDDFDEARKKYGESGAQTLEAALEVERLEKVLQSFDIFIPNQDKYYDDVLASMHPSAPSPTPQLEAKSEVNGRAETLEELMEVVKKLKAAYEAKLTEIKAEEKSVADQLAEERIAKIKQGLGV